MHRKQLETGSPIRRGRALALIPEGKLELRVFNKCWGLGPTTKFLIPFVGLGPYMGVCVLSLSYDSTVQPGARLKKDIGQGQNNDLGRKKGKGEGIEQNRGGNDPGGRVRQGRYLGRKN